MREELSNRSICHLPRYPRKKFWIGKPIARVVKKKTGEFSDKLTSLQRGLREFQGEGWGVHWGGSRSWGSALKEGTSFLLSSLASLLGLLVVFCFLLGISGREARQEINPVRVENGPVSLLGSRVILVLFLSPGKLLRDLEYKTGECPKGCSQFTSPEEYCPHRDSDSPAAPGEPVL